jgi:hypothetical protein
MLDEDDSLRKVNIDDLYEKQKMRDQKQIGIFHKILNRVHNRIKITARNKRSDRHIWYVVPEFLFGEPLYDKSECIAYVVSKLEENGFYIRYVHPNTLFISWDNWVPAYVRNEIKKKRGLVLDEKGNVIKVLNEEELKKKEDELTPGNIISDTPTGSSTGPNKKQYTPIGSYKPSGKLVYNTDMFNSLEERVTAEPVNKKAKEEETTNKIKNVMFSLPF